jgi:hypothetical protein
MLILNERSRWRLVLQIAAIVALVMLLGGAWLAWPHFKQRYRVHQHERALTQTEAFLEAKDLPNARLALDIALRHGAGDLRTLRLAAVFLEQIGSREIMPLRRRILTFDPESVEDRALLVEAALRYGDLNGARDALAGFTPAQADEPLALQASLAYALATANRPMADLLFDRLKALVPANDNLRVRQALLRLQHPDPAVVRAAEGELLTLQDDPRYDLFVQRERLRLAAARRDFVAARQWATRLAADERAVLSDHLNLANLHLNVEQRSFAEVFAAVAPRVNDTTEDAVELLRWLLIVGQARAAADWLAERPTAVREHPAVRALGAEGVAAERDWVRLEALLAEGVWGGRSREVVQLAFTARTAAERGRPGLQRELWQEALTAAGRSLDELRQLHRLAVLWNWEEATEDTLWAILRADSGQAWAHRQLFAHFRAARRTDRLRTLMDTLRNLDPTVPRYRHDWAVLSLLTQRTVQWNPPKTLLATLHAEEPDNPYYRTSHAFALAQANRLEEAVALLEGLTAEEQRATPRLPYLAYIHGKARDREAFERVVAFIPRGQDYLPEEQRLIHDGRTLLEAPGRSPRTAPEADATTGMEGDAPEAEFPAGEPPESDQP